MLLCKPQCEQQDATAQPLVLHSCKEVRMNVADHEAVLPSGKGSQALIAFLPQTHFLIHYRR